MVRTIIPKLFLDREFFAKSETLAKDDDLVTSKTLLDSLIRKSADNGDDSVIRRWNYYYEYCRSNSHKIDAH
jgi:hypothetical protein